MSHDAPFLAQIAADPEVDAPRLIYADWLEEQQDERAEFIRVQCELAATPSPARLRVRGLAEVRGLLQGRRRLAQREKQLLRHHPIDFRSLPGHEIPSCLVDSKPRRVRRENVGRIVLRIRRK